MMHAHSITRLAALSALVAGLACGKNLDTVAKPDETAVKPDTTQASQGYKAGSRDTTLNGPGDSAKARPDQGQPVTAKGDTLNKGVDSSASGTGTTSQMPQDTSSMQMPKDTSSMQMPKDTSSMQMPKDTSTMKMPNDSSSIRVPVDSTASQIPKDSASH
jgi:hypothetical protein